MAEVLSTIAAILVKVGGLVQGVGYRPFVYRLAGECNVKGWVINRSDGVLIHAQGEIFEIEKFAGYIRDKAPVAANISSVEVTKVPAGDYSGFEIQGSLPVPGSITGISPDIAVCHECIDDLKNQPARISYPLINCTNCGPRFSIISKLPYDRNHTSMDSFAMCPVCEKEYTDPEDRRFHAQPLSCNSCGPSYSIAINGYPGGISGSHWSNGATASLPGSPSHGPGLNYDKVSRLLENGAVVAIKGTGGYNLLCDALNPGAAQRIREIKGRERKPFAVMFRNTDKVKEYCRADKNEMDLLQSWRRPVVLLKKNLFGQAEKIPGLVNGGLDTIGAILPYMPFHYLLFEQLKLHALVFTSANTSGDPIVFDDHKALNLFGTQADALVPYNREIINPVDDSVCRLAGKNVQILRRARGYVPEMISLPVTVEGVFAAGSDLKNTFAMGRDNQAVLSQHNGDLENYEVFCRYRDNIDRFASLFSFKPGMVAYDMHPGFHSSKFAAKLAEETGSRHTGVQHHHAHIASCMAEHGIVKTVTGVCFDGTGYGDDGNIWGSEFMVCDYHGYERISHFDYIPLPGGEAAITEPWRIALACLRKNGYSGTERWIDMYLKDVPAENIGIVDEMITRGINTPLSCGAGRLFDLVAALTGLCTIADYDGEAPMLLESICSAGKEDGYDFSEGIYPVIDQVMSDLERGVAPGCISSLFHNGMAETIHKKARYIAAGAGTDKVVLSGGVFQNSYLTERVIRLFDNDKLNVFINKRVPLNDGGLALGQLAIAAETL